MPAVHTATSSDVDEQQELKEDPVLDLEPKEQEEYVDLEIYNNKYYTCDSESDSEGLFALTDFDDTEGWNGDPCHCVHMCKVKVLADKSAIEQPKYPVTAKECLVT